MCYFLAINLAIDKITGMGKKKKSKHRTCCLKERINIEVSKKKTYKTK